MNLHTLILATIFTIANLNHFAHSATLPTDSENVHLIKSKWCESYLTELSDINKDQFNNPALAEIMRDLRSLIWNLEYVVNQLNKGSLEISQDDIELTYESIDTLIDLITLMNIEAKGKLIPVKAFKYDPIESNNFVRRYITMNRSYIKMLNKLKGLIVDKEYSTAYGLLQKMSHFVQVAHRKF
ncbi:MAG: hypothetical protein KDD58_11870 [Bdellovibrionales bacterium]|nr:hypothetical protein [Bdellovibrionales bacterium]